MAVLPESMDKLDTKDAEGSFQKIQDYIRYMGERIEFSMRNVTKSVTAAGVSSAELYVMWAAQQQTLAAVQSDISTIKGNITDWQHQIGELKATVNGHSTAIAAIQDRLDTIESQITAIQAAIDALETASETMGAAITTIQGNITSLDQRVTALEQADAGDEPTE